MKAIMMAMTRSLNIKNVVIILLLSVAIVKTAPTFNGASNNNENINNGEEKTDSGFRISQFKEPERTRESVNLETERLPSQIMGVYDRAQQKITQNSEILPILDTIREEDKYGNNGDQFNGLSRGIVNGYEAFSNLLNALIEKPKEIFRSLSKRLTNQLDIVGGKLVGL